MYHLNVVIIGAGIGGLTTGIAFQQAGYTVKVFERTRELRPAGAGISLWSNGVKVLNRLGLGEKLAAIGGQMDWMEYRSHTDELLNEIDLRPMIQQVGQRPYPVSRTDLQQMLLDALGPEQVELGVQCVGVEETETEAIAILNDGRRVSADVIIGADGVRSTVRDYVIGKSVGPRYADYVNWNGIVPMSDDLPPGNSWVIYVGEGKRASMMPIGGDRFYFFFGAPMPAGTTVEPSDRREELAQLFQGWAQPVQNLIKHLDPLQTNRLEIGDLEPLDRLVRGRVALVGDSGHATTPTLGQGGCQALEDVEILTRYLLTTTISVPDALQRYAEARKDRTRDLVLKARKRTNVIYAKDPDQTEAWYQQLKQEIPSDVTDAIAKIILAGPFG
ncbi:FAD-dependent urate hydroxylase HpxO [Spirulina major CS-329]|uniref:FAD-dependent urate hydroxylase HpxO n=1 Tax=Spirulina TaxID=1154 RepID=UPI002331024F|nr:MULTISPECIES: FAD-dependent urate hydroxylase HpxO [Spirulina]MDB9495013.1 FAD-dependent urate hydroxylase HpxO [Spirulina subsalsa CS-330]MDB9504043.1 FAD-dependent urate hydroxylase HpxO [Spirulina major CS-329]